MIVDRASVNLLHWQHRVVPGVNNAAFGEIAAGYDDLAQDVRTIILTRKGSVPLEPDKFCGALDYVDYPLPVAVPRMTRECWDALEHYAPRIIVEKVTVEYVAFHHFRVPVFWRAREDVTEEVRQTTVELVALEAANG